MGLPSAVKRTRCILSYRDNLYRPYSHRNLSRWSAPVTPNPWQPPTCLIALLSFPSGQRWLASRGKGHLSRPTIQQRKNQLRSFSSPPKIQGDASLLDTLQERGLVNQIIGGRNDLETLLSQPRIGAYLGIDPTAPSLHLGHLVPLMALYWLSRHGHPTYIVLGGFTAAIGDPTGRTTARKELQTSEIAVGVEVLQSQLASMGSRVAKNMDSQDLMPTRALNNSEWLEQLKLRDFMKPLGFNARLGILLGRDTVKTRLESGDGMSVSEFLYPLIQASDWLHLHSNKGISIQIGGADQYGNILSGLEAINAIYKPTNHTSNEKVDNNVGNQPSNLKPAGFTAPLLTTASGDKFGKSAGNAIWLDQRMTSPFDLYQFLLGTPDADVHRYLKLFTFESLATLIDVMERHDQDPSRRVAQHYLARHVLELVHGKEIASQAEESHGILFERGSALSMRSIQLLARIVEEPTFDDTASKAHLGPERQVADGTIPVSTVSLLPTSLVHGHPLSRVLFHAGLVGSKGQGQRLCTSGGAYVGRQDESGGQIESQIQFWPVSGVTIEETNRSIMDGNLLLLRAGKSKIKLIVIVDDEEFKTRKLECPGWRAESS